MESNIINFDKQTNFFLFIITISFIASTIFKLHGLSTNMWDDYLPSQNHNSENIILGKAQGIRSIIPQEIRQKNI